MHISLGTIGFATYTTYIRERNIKAGIVFEQHVFVEIAVVIPEFDRVDTRQS